MSLSLISGADRWKTRLSAPRFSVRISDSHSKIQRVKYNYVTPLVSVSTHRKQKVEICYLNLYLFSYVLSFSDSKHSQQDSYKARRKKTTEEGEEKKIRPLIFCATIDGEINIIQPTETFQWGGAVTALSRGSCLWCWIDHGWPTTCRAALKNLPRKDTVDATIDRWYWHTQTGRLTDECSDTDTQKQQRVNCLLLSFRASDVNNNNNNKWKNMTLTDKALFKQQCTEAATNAVSVSGVACSMWFRGGTRTGLIAH